MPDPVSCHATNNASVIECDPVHVGPEPEASNDFETRGDEPFVRSLVERHSTTVHTVRLSVPPAATENVLSEIAQSCATKAIGAGTAVEGGALLGAFKTGWEFSTCVGMAVAQAGRERSVEMCEALGGTPVGFVFEKLTCDDPSMYEEP